jgi:hypothetical protein
MHEFVENTPRVLLGPVKRRPQEHPHSYIYIYISIRGLLGPAFCTGPFFKKNADFEENCIGHL